MTNLSVPDVSDFTNHNFEVGFNDAALALDQAWRRDQTLDLSSGNVAPAVADAQRTMLYRLDGVATSGRTFTYPALEKPFMISLPDSATNTVDIKKGTTTLTHPIGAYKWYFSGAGANDLWSPEIAGGAVQSAVGTDFLGAVVGIDPNFTLTGDTTFIVDWDRQFFDNIGAHDPATQVTRLTIPTGVTRVNFYVMGGLVEGLAGERLELYVAKNGGAFPGEVIKVRTGTGEPPYMSFETGPISCAATDYFQVKGFCKRTGTFNLENTVTGWGMEVIGGAMLDGAYNAVPNDVKMPFFSGVPGTTTVIHKQVMTQPGTFPDDFAGSQADVGTNPSGTTTFDIDKNGSTVGTVAFSTAGVPTFATTGGATSVAAGDRIEIVTQGSVNAIADIAITLKGFVE